MSDVIKRLVFDVELMRPGCVLLQAAMGGDASLASRLPVDSWLLAPTPGMRTYPVTDEQFAIIQRRLEERWKR